MFFKTASSKKKVADPVNQTTFHRLVFEQCRMGVDKAAIAQSLKGMGLKKKEAQTLLETIAYISA